MEIYYRGFIIYSWMGLFDQHLFLKSVGMTSTLITMIMGTHSNKETT